MSKPHLTTADKAAGGAIPGVVPLVPDADDARPSELVVPLEMTARNVVSGGAYLLPFAAGDLREGEFVVTCADRFTPDGQARARLGAHELAVEGIDPSTKKLTAVLPGGSAKKNEDYRIWGKPVRAMADGVVEDFHDGMQDNAVLGKFPEPTPEPARGNHLWLRHGDELTLYSHLQHESMSPAVKRRGARVKAGQVLGRAGNSGNSTHPRTHIQCQTGGTAGPLRPLPFRNAWVLDRKRFDPPKVDGDWIRVAGQGLSETSVSIWPASTWPTFKIPTAGISSSGDSASGLILRPDLESFQKEVQRLLTEEGRRLSSVATYLEHGHRRWAGITCAGDGAQSFFIGADRAAFERQAQELFTKKGRRLVYLTTYADGPHTRFAGLASESDAASDFFISPDRASFEQHVRTAFDQRGRRLVQLSTFVEGGARRFAGIARDGNWANDFWISRDRGSFEKAAHELEQRRRRLVHLHTYVEDGHRYWAGIARESDHDHRFWVSSDLDSFQREAEQLCGDTGRRLAAVEFLD